MNTQKRAGKEYTCENCAGIIKKGFQYNFDNFWVKQSYDNEFDVLTKAHLKKWRTHINCRLQNL